MHGHNDREGCTASAGARGWTHLVGLVSIGDMVKVIADQKFTIEQLEHYIHGHR